MSVSHQSRPTRHLALVGNAGWVTSATLTAPLRTPLHAAFTSRCRRPDLLPRHCASSQLRRAGLELGVSGSALSHSLKTLEDRLGVRLLHRTTRSVTLTAAGEQLFEASSPAMTQLGDALEGLNQFRDQPVGLIRLNVPQDAAEHLLAPILPEFGLRYPELEVEVAVSNHMMDVIDRGYDAGVRFGGTVPEDMVAQRLSADIRWMMTASPEYLARHGMPKHPDNLMEHRCMRVRAGTGHMYAWELEKDGEDLQVRVPGPIIIDETRLGVALAANGAGIVYTMEPVVREYLDSGALIPVLDDWSSYGPGYYLYYSSKRQLPVGLKLLVDLIRELRPLGF